MSTVESLTDDQLLELVREAHPIPAATRVEIDASASGDDADRVLQEILVIEPTPDRGIRGRTPRPSRFAWAAVSVGSIIAAIAVAGLLALSAGNGSSVAFAGWSATPTTPGSNQVQNAESECQQSSSLSSSSAPVLTDNRGPYTLLLYGGASGGVCVTGPSLRAPTGQPPMAPFHDGSLRSPVADNGIQRIDNAAIVGRSPAPISTLKFNDGRVGAAVTGVTLVLQDGTHVAATVTNGWFAAWWPGPQEAQAAEVVTATCNHAQNLVPASGPGTITPPTG